MDDIIQNRFDHPKFDVNALILVLMPHKFGVNASNLVDVTTILFFLKSCFTYDCENARKTYRNNS
jgi:hypothetical protein